MTREEIVNEIKCLLSELSNGEDAVSYLTKNDVKWLNENIKALEQESTKNNLAADCISRQRAIDSFQDLLPNIGYNKKAITEILQEVPPITPQRSTTKKNLGVEKIEVRKPCINYEDGCEEWAGCPCVHFKARK